MPYFSWRAIDFVGKIHKGTSFARSQQALEAQLLREEKGLLTALQIRCAVPKRNLRSDLCYQMSLLLGAGVRLADALDTVSLLLKHTVLGRVLTDCASGVREGNPMSRVMAWNAPIFDDLMVHMIVAGEEAGALAASFETLHTHYVLQNDLMKKLRSALIVPLITFGFFILVLIGTFVLVIPRFEQFFLMINKPVPSITNKIFLISSALRSVTGIFVIIGLILIIIISIKVLSLNFFHVMRDKFLLRLPLISTLITSYTLTLFLQTLAVLLDGGLQLSQALAIAIEGVGNTVLKQKFETILHDVESGKSMSSSIELHATLRSADLLALCSLGEASGNLGAMMRRAAHLYQEKTYQRLSLIMAIIPPCMLLLIGLFVALLIFAIYMPLLTLGEMIG